MSEVENTVQAPAVVSAAEASAKSSAIVAYALLALGLFTGLPWIIGGIWALVKRSDAVGTKYEDHYTNIIKTFWWSLGLYVLGAVLTMAFVGIFIIMGVWIWNVYKVIKGLSRITSDKSYND